MGEQRKGDFEPIKGATNRHGQIREAIDLEFPLARKFIYPQEMRAGNKFTTSAPPDSIMAFWATKLARLDTMIAQATSTQKEWKTNTGFNRPCGWRTKNRHNSLIATTWGEGPEIGFGSSSSDFPLSEHCYRGVYFQKGACLGTNQCDRNKSGKITSSIPRNLRPFRIQNAQRPWDEAQVHVCAGWVDGAIPIHSSGFLPDIHPEGVHIAFRFGFEKAGKLRACDDLKHNWANLAFSVWAPITLPTWGHIAQSALDLRKHRLGWAFSKAGPAPAYKYHPVLPEHARRAFFPLRPPDNGQRYASPPRALIFGEFSAVPHYNCFSRIITCLTNRILGIPLAEYFDDYGSMLPDSLSKPCLATFSIFCTKLAILLNMDKSLVDKALNFLGLFGEFPNSKNDNLSRISLPAEKATR